MTRRRKRHSPSRSCAKLRDADAMLNAGKDLAAVLRSLEVSEVDLARSRWRRPVRRHEGRGGQAAEGAGGRRTAS